MPTWSSTCPCVEQPTYLQYTETRGPLDSIGLADPVRLRREDRPEAILVQDLAFARVMKPFWLSEEPGIQKVVIDEEERFQFFIVLFGTLIGEPFVRDDDERIIGGVAGPCRTYMLSSRNLLGGAGVTYATEGGARDDGQAVIDNLLSNVLLPFGTDGMPWKEYCDEFGAAGRHCLHPSSWTCDPFTSPVDFDSGKAVWFGVGDFYGAGTFTEGPLLPGDPETLTCKDGCWTRITRVIGCKEDCDAEDRFRVRDTVDDVTYGPFPPTIAGALDGGGCALHIQSAWVFLPGTPQADPPGTYIIEPRDFEIIDHETDAIIETVTVEGDCVPVVIREGGDPNSFLVAGCLTGCPEGGLPGVLLTVQIWSDDGEEFLFQRRTYLDGSGCFTLEMPLMPDEGDYLLRLIFNPHQSGYAETIINQVAGLPGPGEGCVAIPLGDIPAEIDDDYVCTCAGPLPKCLRWDGNGAEITLTWDDSEEAWLGVETLFNGAANDAFLCQDEPPFGISERADMPVKLEVIRDGEECVFLATRLTPICFCGGDTDPFTCVTAACSSESTGLFGTPRLGGFSVDNPSGIDLVTSIQRVVITSPWGPLDFFSGQAFLDWTRPNGDDDPNCCYAPCVAYANVSVTRCP